jgi:putative ABC transport system substrate-binding protein
MDRRAFIGALAGGLLAAPLAAEAQPAGKVWRIGVIVTATPTETEHLIKALTEGLRELGYVERRNVMLELRFAEGRQERLTALAAELVQLKVDVLVTGSNPVIAAVKQATATIPVVMAVSRDPVGAKFISSLARPGGNITGFANDTAPEIIGKNLSLLKEAAPRISRVAFLWNPVPPGADTSRKAVESAARNLGVAFQSVEVRGHNEFEGAFAAMVRERAEGVVVAQDPVTFGSRSQGHPASGEEPAARRLRSEGVCGGWGSHVVWAKHW